MIKTEYNSLLFKLAAKLGVLMIAVILTIVIILDLSIGQTVVMIFTILGVFFLFFIVFRRDIKAFKDFANNLSDKSDFYRQIVVNSLNGLIIAKDGRIVFFNDSAKILFIRTSNNLKNLEIEELIHPSDRDKFSEFITKLPNDKVIFRANVNTLSSQYRYVALNVKNYLINNEPVLYINATDCSKIHLEMLNSKKKIALLSEAIDAFSFGFDIYTKEGEAAYRNSFSQSNKDAQAAKNLQAEIENNFNKSALGNGFNIAAKGDQFSKDLIVARHNGEQWNNVTFSPLYVENQQYVLKITDDITNFKNDINELKLYSNAYEQVLKSSNMAFVIIDKNENIIFENDKFYQMLDLDAELVAKDRIRTAAKDFFKILNPKNIVISLHETNEKISFTEANIDNGIEKICSKITNSDSFEVEIKIETKYLKYFLEKESEKKDEIINTAKIIDLKSKAYPVYNYNGEFTFTIIEFVEVTTLHNLTEKYNIARTYLDAIANNFYVGIIFIINQNDEIVFIGGEEAIKKSIHISGLSTRLFFQLSQIPELVELEKNIDDVFKGSSNRSEKRLFDNLYDFNFFPIRDAKGNIKYCMGIGYNINDRNNYEQQLLTQRALQERIFSESTLAMLIVNSNYRYVNANNEFYKLFGVTWNQIADIDLSDPTNYTENNIMLIDMMKDVFAGKTIEFEMPVRDVFVGFFNVHVERALELNCKMAPITNSDGKIENIIVYLHDITAYKTTVRQLRETQLIYSTVTSNFREGILILLDVNLLYRLVEGDKDLSMLGKNKSQMLGTSIYEDANLFGTTFITYAENALKRESFNFEISSIAKKEDGSEFEIYYNVTFTPIINEKDEVSFVYISLINVTDRKLFEQNILEFNSKLDKEVESRTEQLQKATLALEANYSELQLTQLQLVETQKDLAASLKKEKDLNDMKSQFIALISHEYRTPLTIIHTYIYLLETFYDVQNKDKFLKGIGVISQAVEAMTKLLDNALFLNEYQNHQIELTSISINEFLRSIIESSIDTHKATQKMDVITIRDNIIIDTDKYLLKQIIGNILSNAIKYSSASSVIRIELVDTDDDYTISIQDSGKGIGEDVRGNVFDSFVRSKDVTNISGSGLGLFIVKNCVNMLQGDVSFVTKTNVGTIFTTTFPKKLKNIHNS